MTPVKVPADADVRYAVTVNGLTYTDPRSAQDLHRMIELDSKHPRPDCWWSIARDERGVILYARRYRYTDTDGVVVSLFEQIADAQPPARGTEVPVTFHVQVKNLLKRQEQYLVQYTPQEDRLDWWHVSSRRYRTYSLLHGRDPRMFIAETFMANEEHPLITIWQPARPSH